MLEIVKSGGWLMLPIILCSVIAAAIISRNDRLDRWLPTACAVALTAVTTLALNGVYVP